jgi:hypothetical protein
MLRFVAVPILLLLAYCYWNPRFIMLQHDVLAVACSSLAHAGTVFRFWRETFTYIPPCRKSLPVTGVSPFLFSYARKQ